MAQAWDLNWQRLPLEGMVNARELGGYPVAGGCQTQWHRFLRTDGLSGATPSDLEFLEGYGVSAVLDLRGEKEVEQDPDPSLGTAYLNVPLFEVDASNPEQIRRLRSQGGPTLELIYDLMFENADGVRKTLEFIATAPEGCVLFHCAVGKDRTGVMAAILLMLAGCDNHDVIANYVPSRTHLLRSDGYRDGWERLGGDEVARGRFDSRHETLGHWLARVDESGGIVAYLASCGVSYEVMEAVRDRLLR